MTTKEMKMKLEINKTDVPYAVNASKIKTIEDIKIIIENMNFYFVRTKDNEKAYHRIKHLLD